MSPDYLERIFQKWEIAVTRNLVRQFQETCPSLKRDFVDDLTYECLCHWLSEKDKCDVQKIEKPKKYLAKVITNKLCDLVRRRSAEKRSGYFLAESLDKFLEDNPNAECFIDNSAIDQAIGGVETEVRDELRTRLDRVFKTLTPQQKKVFIALRDEQLTITDLSIRLKVHRITIHREINRIKQLFEDEGLREFFK
jgi:RNA polymerase sigma factor (sigma-70 family)